MTRLMPNKELARARKEKGWTQEVLAKKARISRPMLSHIERGAALPTLEAAYRISKVLGKSIEDIFFKNDARKTSRKTTA